ncbi:MAG TPA: hypothetical protein VN895_02925 [Candidatus Acidoferrum sp.]|nr:hypothetical protein [Candidatus Acidoferrum sp.]
MEYAIGTRGSSTVIPEEWARLITKAREFPEPARMWFLRTVSAFNYSAAQQMASALDPALATPRVAVGSTDGCRAMLVRWLGSPELSSEEKVAVAAAWRLMDRSGISEAEDNPALPIGVRMLLRGSR